MFSLVFTLRLHGLHRRRLLYDARLQPKIVKTVPVRAAECGLTHGMV